MNTLYINASVSSDLWFIDRSKMFTVFFFIQRKNSIFAQNKSKRQTNCWACFWRWLDYVFRLLLANTDGTMRFMWCKHFNNPKLQQTYGQAEIDRQTERNIRHENQNIPLILIKMNGHWCYVPTRFPFTLILINSYCFRFSHTTQK